MRKIIGYSLIVVSCMAWAAMVIIPFLDLETEDKVAWAGGAFIFAEVTWWAAVPILGKEIIEYSRYWWELIKNKFLER